MSKQCCQVWNVTSTEAASLEEKWTRTNEAAGNQCSWMEARSYHNYYVINLKISSKNKQMLHETDVLGDIKPVSLMSSSGLPAAQLLSNGALFSVTVSPNCAMSCASKQPRLC